MTQRNCEHIQIQNIYDSEISNIKTFVTLEALLSNANMGSLSFVVVSGLDRFTSFLKRNFNNCQSFISENSNLLQFYIKGIQVKITKR